MFLCFQFFFFFLVFWFFFFFYLREILFETSNAQNGQMLRICNPNRKIKFRFS
jgi:hypothetical protein